MEKYRMAVEFYSVEWSLLGGWTEAKVDVWTWSPQVCAELSWFGHYSS